MPVCDQRVHGVLRHRVPGHGPAHEVAIARALLVRSLTERGVGDVARMEIGQLADVGGGEGAALALAFGRLTEVPHVKVGDQKRSRLKDREQRDRSVRADKLDGGVYFHHRQPPSSCRNRIPGTGVCLFPYPQRVQFGLPGGSVYHCRPGRSVEVSGEMVLIRCLHRYLLLASPSCIQDAFW